MAVATRIRATSLSIAAAVAAIAVATGGCTFTVEGAAQRASDSAPTGIDNLVLDSGDYPSTPQSFGNADRSEAVGRTAAAQQLAAIVNAPWRIDPTLTTLDASLTMAIVDPASLGDLIGASAPPIASRHGFYYGFSTARTAAITEASGLALTSVMLRFPDENAATLAARELADATNTTTAYPKPAPIAVPEQPNAHAFGWQTPDGTYVTQIFATHGPLTLCHTGRSTTSQQAATTIAATASTRDQTRPVQSLQLVAASDFANTPVDPTGLFGITLRNNDDHGPGFNPSDGVYNDFGAIQFEPDPLATSVAYDAAGITHVSRRLATLYETASPTQAVTLAEYFATNIADRPDTSTEATPEGIPNAYCFHLQSTPTEASFRCTMALEHYTIQVSSDSLNDTHQRLAAQAKLILHD